MTEGHEYWGEVASLARSITDEAFDYLDDEDKAEVLAADGDLNSSDNAREALDERLWETIDGHQWVIYTAYNFDVLRHSANTDYAVENWGVESIVDETGLKWAALAFGALYADVRDHVDFGSISAFGPISSELEAAE